MANADVLLNGTPVGPGAVVTLPANTSQVDLLVSRQAPGQHPGLASTAAFTVVDACGEWKPFVGGGPGAF